MLIDSITLDTKEGGKTYDLTLTCRETIVLIYSGITQFKETTVNKSFMFSSQDRTLTVNISHIDGHRYLFSCKKYGGVLIGVTSETQFIAILLPTAQEHLLDIVQYLKSRPTTYQIILGSVTRGISSFIEEVQRRNLEITEEVRREMERDLFLGESEQETAVSSILSSSGAPITSIQPPTPIQSGSGLAQTLAIVSASQGGVAQNPEPTFSSLNTRTVARGRQPRQSVFQPVQSAQPTASTERRARSRSRGQSN